MVAVCRIPEPSSPASLSDIEVTALLIIDIRYRTSESIKDIQPVVHHLLHRDDIGIDGHQP